MANFDAAAGISVASVNGALAGFYSSASAKTPFAYPFQGSETKTIANIGVVTFTWTFNAAPTVAFGPPSLDIWNASLAANGNTNGVDGNPLPNGAVVQLMIPDLSVGYSIDSGAQVTGDAKNLGAYAALAFPSGEVDETLVGLTIDESAFSAWDKAIFNGLLVPKIYELAAAALGVINIPQLAWNGVQLTPPSIWMAGDQLLAAAVLTTNPQPIDVTGATWPTDPLFVLASQSLLNAALAAGVAPYQHNTFGDSGDYNSLADWSYTGMLQSLTATVGTISPLIVSAQVTLSLETDVSLTAAGMALATVGCAIAGGLLLAAV